MDTASSDGPDSEVVTAVEKANTVKASMDNASRSSQITMMASANVASRQAETHMIPIALTLNGTDHNNAVSSITQRGTVDNDLSDENYCVVVNEPPTLRNNLNSQKRIYTVAEALENKRCSRNEKKEKRTPSTSSWNSDFAVRIVVNRDQLLSPSETNSTF